MTRVGNAVRIRPVEAGVWISQCRARLPFRFGMHTMTAAPLATCRVLVELADGARAEGFSSDLLVPKWFRKSADTPISEDWSELLASQEAAIEVLLEGSASREDSVFEHWRRVYAERVESRPREAVDLLVRGEGVSLVERAMIDAVCRAADVSFGAAIAGEMLGFDAPSLDPSLDGAASRDWIGSAASTPWVRHTVGLVDAIEPEDVESRVGDGLPECLSEDIRAHGLRYFKLKIVSGEEAELDRLARVWSVICREAGPQARVTLDGNEQFGSIGEMVEVLERVLADRRFEGLIGSLLLIEQPLPRARTFEVDANRRMDSLERFAPCIIDEADAGTWSLPEAAGLGYRGVSIKNCKGVFQALLNRLRCARSEGRLIQSGEDLTNLPVVALQQDLALMGTLGVRHIERNGHHYFRGLDHLPEQEAQRAVDRHGDLYERVAGGGRLRISDGRVALGSVLEASGFGYAGPVELTSRIPASSWDPTTLA